MVDAWPMVVARPARTARHDSTSTAPVDMPVMLAADHGWSAMQRLPWLAWWTADQPGVQPTVVAAHARQVGA